MNGATEENTNVNRAFHPTALVESADIGPNTRIWAYAHVLPGARIGANCNIGDHAFIEGGAVLGDGVTIKNGVALWRGVTVEDGVFGVVAKTDDVVATLNRLRPA